MNASSACRQHRSALGRPALGLIPGLIPRLIAGLAPLLAGLTLVISAGTAQAAAYRYWAYFQWDGSTWVYAQTGPSDSRPGDGSIEGWRFAVAENDPRLPRAEGDFEAICGSSTPGAGQKRVAVVLDYGTAEDAPSPSADPPPARGACAVVSQQATGAEVLAAVASQRVSDGLTCGLDGWPTTGCGDQVDGAAPAGTEEPVILALPKQPTSPAETGPDAAGQPSEDSGGAWPWGLVTAGGAAVAGGVAALLQSRRSRSS